MGSYQHTNLSLGMTQQDKERKRRVCQKIWHQETTTRLQLSVYMGVLAIFKEYVMVFQVVTSLFVMTVH